MSTRKLVAGAVLALALAACGDGTEGSTGSTGFISGPTGPTADRTHIYVPSGSNEVVAFEVTLTDGRVVQCVLYDAYEGGGALACDFGADAREGTEEIT